jgi:hypothetical protein
MENRCAPAPRALARRETPQSPPCKTDAERRRPERPVLAGTIQQKQLEMLQKMPVDPATGLLWWQ